MVICLERGADLHTAQLMPLPLTVSCFSKIQIGFTFLVPAHPGSPGKRAVKRVCIQATGWQNKVPSVLYGCWLLEGYTDWVVGCWHSYLSEARCRLAYGPADATTTHDLVSVKSRLVFPFWYLLNRVIPDKGPLSRCVCVCVVDKMNGTVHWQKYHINALRHFHLIMLRDKHT